MDRFKKMFTDKIQSIGPGIQELAQKGYNSIRDFPVQVNPLNLKIFQKSHSTDDLLSLTDRVYWMNFPSQLNIKDLSEYLNSQYSSNYFIWNVSEHYFPTEFFQNQVAVHVHPGYPCLPLIEIFTICKNILTWLNSDDFNIAIVNCQATKGRSVLILSILISFLSGGHPGESLTYVCSKLNVRDYQALFPSQHQYLSYGENILNGLKPNTTSLRLVSIVFSIVPEVKGMEDIMPYIQLFSKGQIIYNSLNDIKLSKYKPKDLNIIFHLNGVEVMDDILVRCKHFTDNSKRIPLFRFMFNTGFIFGNVVRLSCFELDVSSNLIASKDFFIDLIFERGHQKSSQHAYAKEGNTIQQQSDNKWSAASTFQTINQLVDGCQQIVKFNANLQLKLLQQNPLPMDKPQQITQDQQLPENRNSNEQIQVKTQEITEKQEEKELFLEKEQSNESEEQVPQNKQLMEHILSQIDQDQNLVDDDDDLNDYLNQLEQQ